MQEPKKCQKCPKSNILPIFDTFLAIMLNTGDILIFSLQDTFSGIKTQLLIPILLSFMKKNIFFRAKKSVAPPRSGALTKDLVFLES